MLNPLVFSPILAIVLSVIPLSVQQNITADSTCTNYLQNYNNNTMYPNILGIGVVNSTLYIVTPDLMVYQVPSNNIDTFALKIYLNQTYPNMLMYVWPQLYMNQYFMRIMNQLSNVLFYGAVVPMSNMIYTNAAFMTDFEMNPNEYAVFYNITTNGVFPSAFRFPVQLNCPTGNCKVAFISTDMPQYAYAIKVDAMYNIYITRLQAPGQSSMQQLKFFGTFAPICRYSDTQILITRDSDCSRYRGMTYQKYGYVTGFVYQNQFYLIGPYYVDIFNEAIFNAMDTETYVTRIQLSNFFICNGGYIMIIVIVAVIVLILIGICLFCYCRGKEDPKSKTSKDKEAKPSTSAPAPAPVPAPASAAPAASSTIQPEPKATSTTPSRTRLSGGSSTNLLNRRGSAGALAPSRTGSNMSNRMSRVTPKRSRSSLKMASSSKPNLNVSSKRV